MRRRDGRRRRCCLPPFPLLRVSPSILGFHSTVEIFPSPLRLVAGVSAKVPALNSYLLYNPWLFEPIDDVSYTEL